MYIKSIKISGFRNLKSQEIFLSQNTNWIYGSNGQGKTNVLDAIYYACVGKSIRYGAKEKELINFNKDNAFIEISGEREDNLIEISVGINKKGEKKIKVNGTPIRKLLDYWGIFNIISFSPEDINFAKGAPVIRRNFLDMLIAQTKKVYLKQLQEYKYYLKQRNFLLRQGTYDSVLIDTYTEKLIVLGSIIIRERLDAIDFLSRDTGRLFEKLSSGFGEITINYNYSFERNKNTEIKDDLQNAFLNTAQKEKDYGTTIIGPHRDDIDVYINGSLLRKFGSQGQCRSVVIVLKLASINYVKRNTSTNPILLLDDIFSELDDNLCLNLGNVIDGEMQKVLAGPRISLLRNNSKIFKVNDGCVEEK